MDGEDGKVLDPARNGLFQGCCNQWRGGFKAHPEENNLLFRLAACKIEGIQRRIHNSDVSPLGSSPLEASARSRNPHHISKSGEDYAWSACQSESPVDISCSSYADRTARSGQQTDRFREEISDSMAKNGDGVTSANLHQAKRSSGKSGNLCAKGLRQLRVPEFLNILQGSSLSLIRGFRVLPFHPACE